MVLSKLSVPERPTDLDNGRAWACCACSRCGWAMFGLFSLFSLPLCGKQLDIDRNTVSKGP